MNEFKKKNTLSNLTQHFNSIQNLAFKKELDRWCKYNCKVRSNKKLNLVCMENEQIQILPVVLVFALSLNRENDHLTFVSKSKCRIFT